MRQTLDPSKLRTLRLALGLTLREMAAVCDVSPMQLGLWERGRAYPSSGSVRKLRSALGAAFDHVCIDPDEARSREPPLQADTIGRLAANNNRIPRKRPRGGSTRYDTVVRTKKS